MVQKIDFLPTKIKYNSYTQKIELYYRKKNKVKLFKTSIDYDHYIFVDSASRQANSKEYYTILGSNKDVVKSYINPSEARELYNMGRFITAEGDVSPEQRFMCDRFYDTEFPTDINPRIFLLDIEAYVTDNLFPSFIQNTAPINAITIYDTYTKKYYSWFCAKDPINVVEEENRIREMYSKYDNTPLEINILNTYHDLLNSFMLFIKANVPDIISAWNSKFDIPYLVRKIYDEFDLDGLKYISPFNSVSSRVRYALENNEALDHDNIIPGIDVIDMLEMYKKHTIGDRPSFSLKAIAEEELDQSKLAFEEEDGSNPAEMYEKDFAFFCMYNIQDVRLVKLIEDKRKLLNLASIIRNIAKINYKDVFFESIIIDNLFMMEAYKRRTTENWKYVLPSKNKNAEKVKYLGGFCKQPLAGRYKWVADLDYSALYPSINRTFKMSLETIVGKVVDNYQELFLYMLCKFYNTTDIQYIWDTLLPKYLEFQSSLISIVNWSEKIDIKEKLNTINIKIELSELYQNQQYSFIGINDFVDWLKENDYALLPNGVIFDQKVKDAIVPTIFTKMSESRNAYKAIMKQYIAEGNKELSELYDTYQIAVKVINNAIYGVLATERFRLFNIYIAEGITASGQLIIKNSQHMLNTYMKELLGKKDLKDYVLAIDTDSVIFTLEDLVNYPIDTRDPEKLEEIVEYSKKCQKYINDNILEFTKHVFNKHSANDTNCFLSIKNEWLGSAGVFVAKKAYAIHMVFKEGFPVEKTKCAGITLIKSSTPKKLKPFLLDVLEEILKFSSQSKIDRMIAEECEKLKIEFTKEEIALPISINNINSYTKNLPVHVRGARLWNDYFAQSELDKVITGKVKYIYVKSWKNNELNIRKDYVLAVPNKKEYWEQIDQLINVDYSKMQDRLIVGQLERFYIAMGWKMSNMLTSNTNGAFNKLIKKKIESKVKLI